jgi:hypothetical protein
MLPPEYTLSQYDIRPPLTACNSVVILIESSFVEQVEEYTCLNTDSSEILVFDYLYDVFLFEIQHVCKLKWTKWPSEVLSVSVRRLLSKTFHINIQSFS